MPQKLEIYLLLFLKICNLAEILMERSMKGYRKRIVDEELDLRLEAFGAVQIKCPKWCGKTTTAMEHAKSYLKVLGEESHIIMTGTGLRLTLFYIWMMAGMLCWNVNWVVVK